MFYCNNLAARFTCTDSVGTPSAPRGARVAEGNRSTKIRTYSVSYLKCNVLPRGSAGSRITERLAGFSCCFQTNNAMQLYASNVYYSEFHPCNSFAYFIMKSRVVQQYCPVVAIIDQVGEGRGPVAV